MDCAYWMVKTLIAKERLRSLVATHRRKQLMDDFVRLKASMVEHVSTCIKDCLQSLGLLERRDVLAYMLEEEEERGLGILANAALRPEDTAGHDRMQLVKLAVRLILES